MTRALKQPLPDRIHIIGSVGSGKTTLARRLSKNYNIPYYELDNVVWKRTSSGDLRRSDEERDHYLEQIVRSKRWIIEGAHAHHWVNKSFEAADLIIFLDPPYFVRIYRITKRFIRQKLRIEAAHYTPSFKIFKKMFEWNRTFEKESKPQIVNLLRRDPAHSMILNDAAEIEKYFN
ncbi:AAA family ATPase [Sporolactobacillus terrae]|uniref:DNA topology modulation protein FlaR n=1 Tax=Sporolactobacillus terrae TaxID=269673 RepID=A0ABX5Q9T4_9BACL|nr:AAA family ATPase [Sporolactobacillus terrae]QAA23433.1 DNA topology modulation protein FlaR [Sporolactobacillus terrae]QAA26403.1 DNA topology modulation protein FlaR [Sporolactobacillus terrae]UAK15499.1 AAA family ATPase [Sporolactobacillus terrae]